MAGPTLFRPSSITTGLVGYWKFDNDATDSSGSGYNLTANNTPTYAITDYWKTGEYSADLEDGSSQYFSILSASAPNLGFTTAYTIAGWFKVESSTSDDIVFSKWTPNTGFMVRMSANDMSLFHTSTLSSIAWTRPLGKWVHLAWVFNSTNFVAYVDGNCIGVNAFTTVPASTSHLITIGTRSDLADYYDGRIKDLGAWNVALTPIQIKSLALGVDLSLYAYRPTNCATQPTHYWKMNEAVVSGTRAGTVGGVDLTDATTTPSKGGYIEGASPDFTGDYLSAPDSANWDVGTGDFAVSYWAYHDTSVNGRYMFSHGAGPNLGLRYAGGQWNVYLNGAAPISYTYTQPLATWEHYVIKRSGTALSLWIDGVSVATAVNSTNVTGGATVFSIGSFNDGSNSHDGRICDFAFWKGSYPTDAEIKSLACGIPLQQTGIVSYWKLDETSGTRADSIGANSLTDNNTVLSGTGKVSNAADFEASNSEYLSAADSSDWDFGLDGYSVSKWIYFESVGSPRIWSIGGDWASGKGITLGYSGGTLSFYNNGNAGTSDLFTWTPTSGVWYHLSFVRDGANINFKVNSAQHTSSANTDNIDGGTGGMTLGVWSGTLNNYFDGLMDEFLLTKRWLRDEEIKTIYCKGLCAKELTSEERGSSSSSGNFFLFF